MLGRYIAKRVGWSIATVTLSVILVFAAIQALPGDAATQILGQNATPEAVAALRRQLGLDKSPIRRFADWVGGAVHGDFGTSLVSGKPVGPTVMHALVNTSLLATIAILVGFVLAVILGLVAGIYRDRWQDSLISTLSLVGMSIPEFIVATALVLLFAITIPIFPAVVIAGENASLAQLLPAMTLPAASLVIVSAAYIIRMTRTAVIDTMETDFVRQATLKGLPRRRIIFKHVIPSAILPTLNVLAMNIAWLLGGVVVVETVFNYPGIGTAMLQSVQNRDLPTILLITVLSAITFVVCNLVADVASALLNPRLRISGGKR